MTDIPVYNSPVVTFIDYNNSRGYMVVIVW